MQLGDSQQADPMSIEDSGSSHAITSECGPPRLAPVVPPNAPQKSRDIARDTEPLR